MLRIYKLSFSFIITYCSIFLSSGQTFYPQNKFYEDIPVVAKLPINVITGYDPEYDSALIFAFNKYWKFSEVRFIDKDNYEKIRETDANSYFELKKHGYTLSNYTYSDVSWNLGPNHPKDLTCSVALNYKTKFSYCYYYSLGFDNVNNTRPDGTTKYYGIDNTYHDFSNKIIQYVMLMCNQIASTSIFEKASDYAIFFYKKNKVKLNEKTIIVPKEYLDLGITEEVFKTNLSNVESLSSNEIKHHLMTDNSLADKYELIITQSTSAYLIYVISLKDGELIAYNDIPVTTLKKKKMDDELVKKILTGLKKE